jgi:hypothetical protein
MFISKTEKNYLLGQVKIISSLVKDMSLAASEITMLKAKIRVLESKVPEPKKPRKKHTMTPEGRARMSQMMKDRHAKNKLEKQNANSVSTTSV